MASMAAAAWRALGLRGRTIAELAVAWWRAAEVVGCSTKEDAVLEAAQLVASGSVTCTSLMEK